MYNAQFLLRTFPIVVANLSAAQASEGRKVVQ